MNGRDCFDSSYPALQQPWCRCCRSRCRCGWWCVELWTFPGPLWSGWWCGTSWPPLPHWAPADRHSNNIKCEDWMKHVSVGFFFLSASLLLISQSAHPCNTAISPFELMRTHDNHKITFLPGKPWKICLPWLRTLKETFTISRRGELQTSHGHQDRGHRPPFTDLCWSGTSHYIVSEELRFCRVITIALRPTRIVCGQKDLGNWLNREVRAATDRRINL